MKTSKQFPSYAYKIGIDIGDDPDLKTRSDEVQLLCYLADGTAGNLLEIGTNFGRTTRALAIHCRPRIVYGLDWVTDRPSMDPAQVNEMPTIQSVGRHARDLPNVRIALHNSADFDYTGKNIGFVFIDGDHTIAGVRTDTELAVSAFEKGHTARPFTIAWHDYYMDRPIDGCFVGVRQYLDHEFSRPFCHVEGTAVAYANLT